MNKLDKLLYRKNSSEKLMTIWSKGIKVYSDFIKELEAVTDKTDLDELPLSIAKKEIHEAEIPLRHYITSFKLTRREYENHIIPEIEKITSDEEKINIQFEDLDKKFEAVAENEIFKNYEKRPENIELIEVNESIRTHIDLLKNLIENTSEEITKTESPLTKSRLNVELFKYNLQLISNRKRLQEREDYYFNQFKPRYDKDMAEADKYLDKMLDRANEIVALGIDMKLPFMLKEYEKNKHDKEKVWLFYTALKSRLQKISKGMRKEKGKFNGKMHLAEEIVK
jgi:hypothetical protein